MAGRFRDVGLAVRFLKRGGADGGWDETAVSIAMLIGRGRC